MKTIGHRMNRDGLPSQQYIAHDFTRRSRFRNFIRSDDPIPCISVHNRLEPAAFSELRFGGVSLSAWISPRVNSWNASLTQRSSSTAFSVPIRGGIGLESTHPLL